jgi:hypothetical protein
MFANDDLIETSARSADRPTSDAPAATANDVAVAEAALRARYGTPVSGDKPEGDAVGFQLPDGRQVALQRDATVTVWIEAGGSLGPPAVGEATIYAAEQGRHSNLPPRLKHSLAPSRPVYRERGPVVGVLERPVFGVCFKPGAVVARKLGQCSAGGHGGPHPRRRMVLRGQLI